MTDGFLTTIVILLVLVIVAQVVQILLTSLHNARLAREILGLQKVQAARYALQVKLHREEKSAEALVADAMVWLRAQATEAMPEAALGKLDSPRVDAELQSLELLAEDGRRLIVSPYDAPDLRRRERERLARTPELIRAASCAPLVHHRRRVQSAERSLMNAGDYFDLEAAQAGKLLSIDWAGVSQLWFHVPA